MILHTYTPLVVEKFIRTTWACNYS